MDSSLRFPGGPVVNSLSFHCRGHRFDSCVGQLHMLSGMAKKKKSKK